MEIINYETIKEKLNNCIKNKLYIELYIKDQEQKEKILCKVFNKKSIKETIDTFKYTKLDDITILEYETINKSNNRVTNNLVIVGKDNDILKVERYQPLNLLMYRKETISIYNDKRLVSQIYIEKINCVTRTKILNKIKETNRYNQKDYTFYSDNIEIISLRINNEMCVKGENGFTSALNTATDLVNKTSTKITDKINEMLGLEIVKEYKIVRKKRGQ